MLPAHIKVRESTCARASSAFKQAIVTYFYELVEFNPKDRWDTIERELENICQYKVEKIGNSKPKTVRLSLKRTLQRIHDLQKKHNEAAEVDIANIPDKDEAPAGMEQRSLEDAEKVFTKTLKKMADKLQQVDNSEFEPIFISLEPLG